ncbi:Regulator of sigma-E protease RseP [Chamberlinius hualienensis]
MTWIVTFIFIVILFWASLLFIDAYMRSFHGQIYQWFLDKCGLTLKVGQLRWTTSRYNRLIVRLGARHSRFFRVWYNIGAVVGAFLFIPAIFILLLTIFNNISSSATEDDGRLLLKPVLPGVNLPGTHIPFYITTLVICLIFHELGHGLAAVQEDVHLFECGLMVVGVLPAAFVHFSTEQLQTLHPWRQLKVYSAGIWHNVVLVIVAVFILLVSPFLFSLGYTQGEGIVVQDVDKSFHPGLVFGDWVTGVDGCQVTDFNSWYDCLYKVASSPQVGQCISEDHLEQYKWNSTGMTLYVEDVDCCLPDDLSGVCFMWLNPSSDPQKIKKYSCIGARKLFEQSETSCYSEEECNPGSACMMPSVFNGTRLIRINRHGKNEGLFIQRVSDFYYSVTTSNFVPKSSYVPIILPYVVDNLLRYLISFSGALALLNAVPCHALDGQWLVNAILQLSPFKWMRRPAISYLVVWAGTLLLGVTVITGINTIM